MSRSGMHDEQDRKLGHWKTVLEEDLRALGLPNKWRARYRFTNRIAFWTRLLRITEFRKARSRGPYRVMYYWTRWKFGRLSEAMGFDIPLGVFGPGLSIAHRGTIVVNGDARVGANCRIHPGVTIGASKGIAPIIGRDVFIGPNVLVIGEVHVGDGCVLGPQSLVNFDVQSGSTVLAPRAEARVGTARIWTAAQSAEPEENA